MSRSSTKPPRRLAFAVACVAAAMLLVEVVVTRLFSVLFFYHFSFFAVSLVMSGLVVGGLLAARFNVQGSTVVDFDRWLSTLSLTYAAATIAAMLAMCWIPGPESNNAPSLATVALFGSLFLPGLVAAGAFLAIAFARDRTWIGRLYAWDLIAAAGACIAAVLLLRFVQGPAVLTAPALFAAVGSLALASGTKLRAAAGIVVVASVGLLVADLASGRELLRLNPGPRSRTPLFERWNEHSRVQAFDTGSTGRYLVIDRSAGTMMRPIPPKPDGGPIDISASWGEGAQYPVYATGRPIRNVAIIGAGGGQDLLPALAHGAERVDGYELNGILVDLLQRDFRDFNALATRPEVSLIHSEARIGIAQSGKTYDVIQASLIDTWAATASGGFVLSENGLYTREGWRTFLSHLSETGVLTMTRWHLPDAPAETHRLVALAVSGLMDVGIADTRARIVLIRSSRDDRAVAFTKREGTAVCTILVSPSGFTADEIARLAELCSRTGAEILAEPNSRPADATIDRLLDPSTLQQAIAESPFDITPPDDLCPYFFLQVRPADLANIGRSQFGGITEITFNGVRVMVILGGGSLILVVVVLLLTWLGVPGAMATPSQRRSYRWMSVYFVGIGFGYVMIQLGLHQRLNLILGHPTLALSVVLFAMLLGTGLGSAASATLFPTGRVRGAAMGIVGTLAVLSVGLPWFSYFESTPSFAVRVVLVGTLVAVVGAVLGVAFPLGVRRVARTGESAVQRMWAINGAASIAATVVAALVGLTLGTQMVLVVGALAYVVAGVAGTAAEWNEGEA